MKSGETGEERGGEGRREEGRRAEESREVMRGNLPSTKATGLVYEWHIMESHLSAKANGSP